MNERSYESVIEEVKAAMHKGNVALLFDQHATVSDLAVATPFQDSIPATFSQQTEALSSSFFLVVSSGLNFDVYHKAFKGRKRQGRNPATGEIIELPQLAPIEVMTLGQLVDEFVLLDARGDWLFADPKNVS